MNRHVAQTLLVVLALGSAPILSAATLTLAPVVKSVEANAPLQGVVTIDSASPVQLVVSLSSSNASAASVPASITINKGALKASFPIDVNAVSSDTQVTIRASAATVDKTVSFTVLAPARLTGVALNPDSIVAGQPVKATASINRPAGHGGVPLAFGTSKADVATVPAAGTVPAGSSSVSVPVTTKDSSSGTVTIHSTLSGLNLGAALTVEASPMQIVGLTVPSPLFSGQGQRFGTVTLNHGATGNTTLTFSTDHPHVTVQPTCVIVNGQSSGSFTVLVSDIPAGAPSSTAQVTATLGSSTRTATFTVEGLQIALTSLTVPASVLGGKDEKGSVQLNVPAPQDVTVALSSSSANLTVPPSVVVPAGQAAASFELQPTGLQTGASSTTSTITATFGATTKRSSVLVAAPRAAIAKLSVPSPIQAGAASQTGQIALAEASVREETISLTRTLNNLEIPGSLVIPAGQTTATFPITADLPEGAASMNATISAVLNSVSTKAQVVVNAPVPSITIASFAISPPSVVGGAAANGTVTLSTAAPSSGQTVFVSVNSAGGIVTAPVSFVIPAGQTSGTFPVTTTRPVSPAGAPLEIASVSLSARIGAQPSVPASMMVSSPRLERIAFTPASVQPGERSATGRIELNAPAGESGVRVDVSCRSNSASLPCDSHWSETSPGQVLVPAGQRSVDFSTNLPDASLNVPTSVIWNFTGTSQDAPGTAGGMLTIKQLLPSLTFSSSTVRAGESVTGTVRLSDIPTNNTTVTLTRRVSDRCQSQLGVNTQGWLPASVMIPAGQQSATFTVATEPPACDVNLRVDAVVQAATGGADLTVTSARVVSITASPSTVVAGEPFSIIVTLDNDVPSGAGLRGITLNKIDPESILGIQTGMVGMSPGQRTVTITGQTRAGAASTPKTVTFSASRPPDQEMEVRTILTVNPQ